MERTIVALLLTGLLAGCAKEGGTRIEAGGSTFAFPLVSLWAGEYEKLKGVEVRYQSIGSGLGIDGMLEKKFDFGCTDGPMDDGELAKAQEQGGVVVHIPLAMGGVAPIYNLTEVKTPLRFTGPVLAEIFLGKIQKWNDPALQRLNPDVPLPDKDILTVHRSDASGTTYIWTDYLSKVSPEWQTRVGKGRVVKWPTGLAENGNQRVAGAVRNSPASIGYAELTQGIQDNVQYGLVQNREGEFIKPSPQSVTAAAAAIVPTVPDDLRYSLTDAPGKDSYPVSGTVWAVLYVGQTGPRGKSIVDFLRWATHEGQAHIEKLHYARLPQTLVERLDKKLDQVVTK